MIATPMHFANEDVTDWLMVNDMQLLRDVTAYNEMTQGC